MATLTVTLPDALISRAEEQAVARGYGSGSDRYVREARGA
jgi:Arc/MetJ-type ribon-helix-helix transcriptional regulator